MDINTLKGKSVRQFRRNIGMIFQSFNLVTRISVIKNVLVSFVPEMPFWKTVGNLHRTAEEAGFDGIRSRRNFR